MNSLQKSCLYLVIIFIMIMFLAHQFLQKKKERKEMYHETLQDILHVPNQYTPDQCECKYEYIIIGSGPAGLQCAYFLEKFKKTYLILEKTDEVGSFFKKYPIHRKLISINKVYTGEKEKEFNLRHDWNSLLCDDDNLLFKNYSKEYYPHADAMVKYLNDFHKKYKLRINYNSTVISVGKDMTNTLFNVKTKNENYKCHKVIVCSGMFKPHRLNIEGAIHYSDLTTEKTKFKNKNILILGQGNSAFETANYLLDTAAIIHIFSNGPLKLAWQTHYVGHLRAINNDFLDSYQLKSQNGLSTLYESDVILLKNGKHFIYDTETGEVDDQGPEGGYDYVIDCSGFMIDTKMFQTVVPEHNGKVPLIKSNFESVNVNNLFFAGVLAQHISYKKSSGAFIHGFRYLIRSMIRMQTNNLPITIFDTQDTSGLFEKVFWRINNASGIFQMFGCLVDIIIFKDEKIYYIEEIPFRYFEDYYKNKLRKVIIVSLDYGNFGGVIERTRKLGKASYVFGEDRVSGHDTKTAHKSNFLHPIFKFYLNSKLNKEFHLSEHLMSQYKLKDVHVDPLKKFLHKCYSKN